MEVLVTTITQSMGFQHHLIVRSITESMSRLRLDVSLDILNFTVLHLLISHVTIAEVLILQGILKTLENQASLNERILKALEDQKPKVAERREESKVSLETSNSLNSMCSSYSVVVSLHLLFQR